MRRRGSILIRIDGVFRTDTFPSVSFFLNLSVVFFLSFRTRFFSFVFFSPPLSLSLSSRSVSRSESPRSPHPLPPSSAPCPSFYIPPFFAKRAPSSHPVQYIYEPMKTDRSPSPSNNRRPTKPTQPPHPFRYRTGEETSCPSSHFRNMRLVLNLSICGSVAGNRFWVDCPTQAEQFPTCNEYVKSRPKEVEDEFYWKIRGVYVYERGWERKWV